MKNIVSINQILLKFRKNFILSNHNANTEMLSDIFSYEHVLNDI